MIENGVYVQYECTHTFGDTITLYTPTDDEGTGIKLQIVTETTDVYEGCDASVRLSNDDARDLARRILAALSTDGDD